MIIVGVNAYHGDSSACLLVDGKLIAAAEEERFRRVKHWAGFPSEASRYCLQEAKVSLGDVDHFAINRDPKANLLKKVCFSITKRLDLKFVLEMASELLDNNYINFAYITIFQLIEQEIKKLFIREFDQKEIKLDEEVVYFYVGDDRVDSVLEFVKTPPGESDYFKFNENDEKSTKEFQVGTLFYISCYLLLKANKDEAYLKQFAKKNKLRNAIAHNVKDVNVTDQDVLFLLDLIDCLQLSGLFK